MSITSITITYTIPGFHQPLIKRFRSSDRCVKWLRDKRSYIIKQVEVIEESK